MLKPSNRITHVDYPAIQVGARERMLGMLVGSLPWLIISALLWAGLYIKPQPVGTTVTPPLIEPRDHFYGLTTLPDGTLWAAGSNGKIIARSADGQLERLNTPTQAHLQDIAAWNGDHGVAVGNGGEILFTTDGGHNWFQSKDVPRSEIANKLLRVRVAKGGVAIATGEMGALLFSNDYGRSWRRLRPEEDLSWNDVAILEDGHLVVVGEFGTILTSADSGASWEEITSPVASSLMSVSFRDALQGVAVGLEGRVLLTRDGGQSWQDLDTDIQEHLFDVLWDSHAQRWFGTGTLGRWVQVDAAGHDVRSGRLDGRDLSWHTRALAVGSTLWLAGANIGAYDGQSWSPLKP